MFYLRSCGEQAVANISWPVVLTVLHGDIRLAIITFLRLKITTRSKSRSTGQVVMGDDSCSRGCGFESWHHILDWSFSHWFVAKIVLFLVGPFLLKKRFSSRYDVSKDRDELLASRRFDLPVNVNLEKWSKNTFKQNHSFSESRGFFIENQFKYFEGEKLVFFFLKNAIFRQK